MIPEFILNTCAQKVEDYDGFGNDAYYFSTVDRDGWVVYWPDSEETLHTYRDPADWL